LLEQFHVEKDLRAALKVQGKE